MALALLLLLIGEWAATVLSTHNFEAFEVGCDNMRSCQLVGMPPPRETETDPPGVGFILSRKGGADAPVTVVLNGWEVEDLSGWVVVDGSEGKWTVGEDAQLEGDTLALIRAVVTAKATRLLGTDGKVKALLPTKGAAAAMRWIDEQQKREGTVTALVAGGPSPASAVPPLPPLPAIPTPQASSAAPQGLASADLSAFRAKFDCFDDLPVSQLDYFRLDAGHTLVLMPCTLGAYQGTSVAVIVPAAGRPSLAQFDQPKPVEESFTEDDRAMIVSADYDRGQRLLWEEYRGRGLSDCGSNTAWAWDGHRFRIAFHSRLNRCEGVTARITLWQTRNRPDE